MKYAILIPDGAADEGLAQLGGKTPFEAARKPFMDELAGMGRQGTARTVPEGFESGSDVATMSLLGYDPVKYHTGRAPLEAAAKAIPLSATDWVFRCNLVTVIEGIMKDHSAGGISDEDAGVLLKVLADEFRGELPLWEFHQGVSYRNLLVYRGKDEFKLTTKPPHEIPELPAKDWLPKGEGAEVLNRIIARSAELFAKHPLTAKRRAAGVNPATQAWLWGQGKAPHLDTFEKRFGVKKGCMITGVDLLRGLARLLGWECHEVAGMTSFHDTDYAAQGKETAAILDKYDIVVSHVESPDEASHQADWKTKVEAIEAIDEHVVGPVLKKLRTYPEWRLLVLPDHPTNIATRKHGYAPTCFVMGGTGVKQEGKGVYSEANAKATGLHLEEGHELMAYFLKGGK